MRALGINIRGGVAASGKRLVVCLGVCPVSVPDVSIGRPAGIAYPAGRLSFAGNPWPGPGLLRRLCHDLPNGLLRTLSRVCFRGGCRGLVLGWAVLLVWLAGSGAARAELELSGRWQQEFAYRVAAHPVWTKGLAFVQVQGVENWGGRGQLTAIGRVWYDPALDRGNPWRLNPSLAPGASLQDAFVGSELKEVYLDVATSRVDLRLGRQIVRWGLLEGARITDRINPLDFREFLFRDVEDRYIPLWMARLDYYPDWGPWQQAQLLLIPDLRFHRPAPVGSEWHEFELPPGVRRPRNGVENTEVAALAGFRSGEVSWTASYFYTWDDFPAAFRSIFGVGGQLTGVSLDARYERIQILGLTASRSLWGVILSLEGAYDRGKYLATDPGAVSGNEVRRDVAHAGLGVDMNLAGVDVSIGGFQDQVLGWQPFIPVRRAERGGSLLIHEGYLNERLDARLLILYFHTGNQYVARPEMAYKITDRVKVIMGVDLLGGERGSAPNDPARVREFRFVGYFRDHDRVHAQLAWRF